MLVIKKENPYETKNFRGFWLYINPFAFYYTERFENLIFDSLRGTNPNYYSDCKVELLKSGATMLEIKTEENWRICRKSLVFDCEEDLGMSHESFLEQFNWAIKFLEFIKKSSCNGLIIKNIPIQPSYTLKPIKSKLFSW